MARRKKQARVRKVVAVDWEDATGATEWTTEEEAKLSIPAVVTTIGVILVKDDQRVVIAGTLGHGSDRAVGDVTTIPAQWIRSITPLGEVLIAEAEPTKV
jgi:hypothetical protein